MVKMKTESNLQITFSKRKHGFFKKASELCTLCGVEMGVIVFLLGRKAFSFRSPDVKSVVDNFKNYIYNHVRFFNDGPNANIQALNSIFTEELAKFEVEKVTKNYLDQIKIRRDELEQWWENPLNQLDIPQTTCLINVLENLKMELGTQQSQNLQAIVPHEDSCLVVAISIISTKKECSM
ncbi:unnamed protein product, partial [Thlaspi arvense]